eukprot:sb/3470660/
MDKFVKKLSREEALSINKSKRPLLKQATLKSLGGVTDVKRILRIKELLDCKGITTDQILSLISELDKSPTIPIHVVSDTGIGRSIGPLRKHSNDSIASVAKRLISAWKGKIRDMPIAPVSAPRSQFSLLTTSGGSNEDIRKRAVRLILANMQSSDSDSAKVIERDIFIENEMNVDKNYKTKVRQKVFEMKRNQSSSSSKG